jgi:hypothetical protein
MASADVAYFSASIILLPSRFLIVLIVVIGRLKAFDMFKAVSPLYGALVRRGAPFARHCSKLRVFFLFLFFSTTFFLS